MTNTIVICLIISVIDGDTMKARCDDNPVTIRLAEIDAPEKNQEFGIQSKKSLSDLCLDKKAYVVKKTRDRYKRIIAYVNCAGVDANTEQVKRGMAWAFDRYITDHGLYKIQNNAQSNNIGLWTKPSPTSPWQWREKERYKNKTNLSN